MNTYSVSEGGWIPKIMQDLRTKKECQITVSGKDAMLIVGKITHMMDRLPFLDFPGIPKIEITLPGAGNRAIDPLTVPFFLSAIGALGAAGASVAYVLGVAHAVGYKMSVGYDAKDPFTLLDDQLVLKLW